MTKISNSSSPESFSSSSKFTKTRFRTPLGEQLPCSPRPLSRMGRGVSIPLSLEGYGVSDLSQLINYYLARERKFQGAIVLGTFAPGSESSIPWYFRSRERKFLGAKVPVTRIRQHVKCEKKHSHLYTCIQTVPLTGSELNAK